jgi:hypothetical protein
MSTERRGAIEVLGPSPGPSVLSPEAPTTTLTGCVRGLVPPTKIAPERLAKTGEAMIDEAIAGDSVPTASGQQKGSKRPKASLRDRAQKQRPPRKTA